MMPSVYGLNRVEEITYDKEQTNSAFFLNIKYYHQRIIAKWRRPRHFALNLKFVDKSAILVVFMDATAVF